MPKEDAKIWISNAAQEHRSYFVDLTVMTDDIPGSKRTREETDRLVALCESYEQGIALSDADFPNALVCSYRDKKINNVPYFFFSSGFFFVSEVIAEIIGSINLGDGYLKPISIYQWDKRTLYEASRHYLLVFCARKDAFIIDKSNRDRLTKYEMKYGARWAPVYHEDNDIALNASVASEGADVWVDNNVAKSFFVSHRLESELKAKRFAARLFLKRCRLIA